MQGQSPYLVNVGLFFNSNQIPGKAEQMQGWTASLLYNVIGKRLIGVGRSVGTGNTEIRVPDSYEMPRHQLDFNIAKRIGRLDLRLSVRDLLAQRCSSSSLKRPHKGKSNRLRALIAPGAIYNSRLVSSSKKKSGSITIWLRNKIVASA